MGNDHGQRAAQRDRAREPVQFDGLDAGVTPRVDRTLHGTPVAEFRTQQHPVVRNRRPADRSTVVDENGRYTCHAR